MWYICLCKYCSTKWHICLLLPFLSAGLPLFVSSGEPKRIVSFIFCQVFVVDHTLCNVLWHCYRTSLSLSEQQFSIVAVFNEDDTVVWLICCEWKTLQVRAFLSLFCFSLWSATFSIFLINHCSLKITIAV